jgi:hypothetical protein
MVRNIDTSSSDKAPDNLLIIRIDLVYKQNSDGAKTYYYNGTHYNQTVSTNILEWITSAANIPQPGEHYFMQCLYIKIDVNKYIPEECPRCGGNGWYVNIIDTAGSSIQIVDGSSKLAQDFIKILYTDKNTSGYGTSIRDVIGMPIYDPKSIYSEIVSSIKDCEEQIKKSQKEASINGINISEEEILSSITVNTIQYVKDQATFYVSVSLINVLGTAIKFNFKI